MLALFRSLFTFITAITIFITSLLSPVVPGENSENLSFDVLSYPEEAVVTFSEAGITVEEYISRADAGREEYVEAAGYTDVKGVLISPYYTAEIAGTAVPVYCTTAFSGETQKGLLQSFSEVYFEKGTEFSFNIELTSLGITMKNAICLPESTGVGCVTKDGKMTATISDFGIYTFLFNNAGQDYAYTLFVRENSDDEEEIAKLKNELGEENVIIVEGYVEAPWANITEDNKAIYLKRGAYVAAQHMYDIESAEDEALYVEKEAIRCNSIGLTRMPFVNVHGCDNFTIAGNGLIDLTQLDRRERRGVVFTNASNVTAKGFKIVNSPEWSFITYDCENVEISAVDIFGYRLNADAFAICSSRNVTVTDSFCRTGDDLFDVKGLGGREGIESRNIVFSDCVAWGGKARCYGICGEVHSPISDVTFKDSAVIIRDATWHEDRIASLAIIVEEQGGSINNVKFENIEIFRDDGRAIGVVILGENIDGFSCENISFSNISYKSGAQSKVSSNGKDNTISVSFRSIFYGNKEITDKTPFAFTLDSTAEISFR